MVFSIAYTARSASFAASTSAARLSVPAPRMHNTTSVPAPMLSARDIATMTRPNHTADDTGTTSWTDFLAAESSRQRRSVRDGRSTRHGGDPNMTSPSEHSTGDNPPPDDHRRAERP